MKEKRVAGYSQNNLKSEFRTTVTGTEFFGSSCDETRCGQRRSPLSAALSDFSMKHVQQASQDLLAVGAEAVVLVFVGDPQLDPANVAGSFL